MTPKEFIEIQPMTGEVKPDDPHICTFLTKDFKDSELCIVCGKERING